MVVTRKSTGSQNKPVFGINQTHQNYTLKVFRVVVFFARFQAPVRTLDWDVAAIYGCPATRKLPEFFGVKNFTFKVVLLL